VKVSIPISGYDPTALLGCNDAYLKKIQEQFNIIVAMRNEHIYLKGDEDDVKAAAKEIKNLI